MNIRSRMSNPPAVVPIATARLFVPAPLGVEDLVTGVAVDSE